MRVRLLGEFDFDIDTMPIVAPQRHREVLAILALRRRRVTSRVELADLLWDDDPPPNAERTLTTYVSKIRSAHGPIIETRSGGYTLADDIAVDEDAFVALDGNGRAAAKRGDLNEAERVLAAALALWTGPYLGSLSTRRWAQGSSARMNEYRLEMFERRASLLLTAGLELPIAELEQSVIDHPDRESLRVLHVRSLTAAGRRTDALRAYERASRHLRSLTGLEPGPGLRSAEVEALVDNPALGFHTRVLDQGASVNTHANPVDQMSSEPPPPQPPQVSSRRFGFRSGSTSELPVRHEVVSAILHDVEEALVDEPYAPRCIVVSGGPGSGRSTILRAVLDHFTLPTAIARRPSCILVSPQSHEGPFGSAVTLSIALLIRLPTRQRAAVVSSRRHELEAISPGFFRRIGLADYAVEAGSRIAEESGLTLSGLGPEHVRFVVTTALTQTLDELVAPTSVVLIDDGDHLDRPSADIFRRLARTANRVVVLGLTSGVHAPQRERAGTHLADEIGVRQRYELLPWSRPEIAQLIDKEGTSSHTINELEAQTGGNPRLLEAVLTGRDVPSGRRAGEAFVRRSIGLLGEPGHRVAQTLALLEPGLTTEDLTIAVGMSRRQTSTVLHDLVTMGLVRREGRHDGDRAYFASSIAGDAVIGSMSPAVMQRTHADIAERLLAEPGGPNTALRVLPHLLAAGDLVPMELLVSAARRATDAAIAMADPSGALAILPSVLERITALAAQAASTVAAEQAHAWLLVRFSQALEAEGAVDDAVAAAERALGIARRIGDDVLAAWAIDALVFAGGVTDRHGGHELVDWALEAIDADAEAVLVSRLHISSLMARSGQGPTQIDFALEGAFRHRAKLQGPQSRFDLLEVLIENTDPSDTATRMELFHEIEALAAQVPGNLQLQRGFAHVHAAVAASQGDVSSFADAVERHRVLVELAPTPRSVAGTLQKQSLLAYYQGHYELAEHLTFRSTEACAHPDYQVGHLSQIFMVRRSQERLQELAPFAAAIAAGNGDPWMLGPAALLLAAVGEHRAAALILEQLPTPTLIRIERHLGGLFTWACVGEAAALVGTSEQRHEIRSLLVRCDDRDANLLAVASLGPVSRIIALLDASLGDDPTPRFLSAEANRTSVPDLARIARDRVSVEQVFHG